MVLRVILVVVIITLLGGFFGKISDFLINPSVNVPDNIPIPGGK